MCGLGTDYDVGMPWARMGPVTGRVLAFKTDRLQTELNRRCIYSCIKFHAVANVTLKTLVQCNEL